MGRATATPPCVQWDAFGWKPGSRYSLKPCWDLSGPFWRLSQTWRSCESVPRVFFGYASGQTVCPPLRPHPPAPRNRARAAATKFGCDSSLPPQFRAYFGAAFLFCHATVSVCMCGRVDVCMCACMCGCLWAWVWGFWGCGCGCGRVCPCSPECAFGLVCIHCPVSTTAWSPVHVLRVRSLPRSSINHFRISCRSVFH